MALVNSTVITYLCAFFTSSHQCEESNICTWTGSCVRNGQVELRTSQKTQYTASDVDVDNHFEFNPDKVDIKDIVVYFCIAKLYSLIELGCTRLFGALLDYLKARKETVKNKEDDAKIKKDEDIERLVVHIIEKLKASSSSSSV